MNRWHSLFEHVFLTLVVWLVFRSRVFDKPVDTLQLLLTALVTSFAMCTYLCHIFVILIIFIHMSFRETLSMRHIAPFNCAWIIHSFYISHLNINFTLFIGVHLWAVHGVHLRHGLSQDRIFSRVYVVRIIQAAHKLTIRTRFAGWLLSALHPSRLIKQVLIVDGRCWDMMLICERIVRLIFKYRGSRLSIVSRHPYDLVLAWDEVCVLLILRASGKDTILVCNHIHSSR